MNTGNGKIAEESKQRMLEALLKIMEIYDYREITVTQIAQEAGLSRNTFYRLFGDKDEILELMLEGLFREFYAHVQEKDIKSFWQLMQVYFDFWEQHSSLLSLLAKNRLLARILEQSYSKAAQVFRLVHAGDRENQSPLPLPYLLAFSVGGMQNMLIKWAESGMDIPSAELIKRLRSCLMYEGLPI